MTKKDFTIIADSLAVCVEMENNDLKTMSTVIDQIALDLLRANPQFRTDLFMKEIRRYALALNFSLYRDRKDARIENIISMDR